jgi:hypothetical protein
VQGLSLGPAVKADHAAIGRILDGVVQQIGERAAQIYSKRLRF